ncbi:TPA_asm: maturation protein, partial [ssRNA phage Zoerhiza.1_17]
GPLGPPRCIHTHHVALSGVSSRMVATYNVTYMIIFGAGVTDLEDPIKRRVLTFREGHSTYGAISGTFSSVKDWDQSHYGYEETHSRSNGLWLAAQRGLRNPHIRGDARAKLLSVIDHTDMGHGFYNYKNYYYDNSSRCSGSKGTTTKYVWDGLLFAHREISRNVASDWPILGSADWLSVLRNGATAIARVRPNKSEASLAQFIGELREELPSVPLLALRDQASHFRSLGSEYLNVEFGWLPFISDLQKIVHALKNRNKILKQLVRDSDRTVRRRYNFPAVRDQVVTDLGLSLPAPALPFPTVYPSTKYAKTLTEVTGRNDWFVGKFRYHIPGGQDLLSELQRFDSFANRLLGTRVTPATLWELTPWSWLLDWFGNFGDVISNFSNLHQDNQVMTYGYSMSTVYKEKTYSLSGSPIGPLTQTFGSKYQLRLKASPYGFGVDWPDFSAYQLSILAALGMSRR